VELIPTDVRQFLDQKIASIAQLEVLLFLKQHSDRDWSAAEIAKELYTAADMCEALLADWARQKVFAATGSRYRYVHDPQRDDLIERVAQLYQERRVTVITTIYAKPVDRVQTFADAFRLRGDKK
jgi:hypothetical protein